jgi:hypothetical protein
MTSWIRCGTRAKISAMSIASAGFAKTTSQNAGPLNGA